jgi:hypothetical protein
MTLRTRFLPVLLVAVLAAAVGLLASACGGDDDDGGGGGGTATETHSPAASTAPAEGPGTITLTSTTIEGQNGKILLVFATGDGGQRLARACIPITSDSFEVSGAEMTEIPAQDPCGSDPDVVTFDEGSYQITAGVYVGGEQSPEAETTLTVEVAGNVTAELDGAELSG